MLAEIVFLLQAMEFDAIIERFYQLPEESRAKLNAIVCEVAKPKGYIIIRAGRIERYLYFLKKGIVRAYTDTVNGQVTFWFGMEGATVLSLKSYVANQNGYETIGLLEDCTLYKLNVKRLRRLFKSDIYVANWGRELIENKLIKTEERLISMQFKTGHERYTGFLQNYPELLQRVQLGYIASYLGMSHVSLSRIRAELR